MWYHSVLTRLVVYIHDGLPAVSWLKYSYDSYMLQQAILCSLSAAKPQGLSLPHMKCTTYVVFLIVLFSLLRFTFLCPVTDKRVLHAFSDAANSAHFLLPGTLTIRKSGFAGCLKNRSSRIYRKAESLIVRIQNIRKYDISCVSRTHV